MPGGIRRFLKHPEWGVIGGVAVVEDWPSDVDRASLAGWTKVGESPNRRNEYHTHAKGSQQRRQEVLRNPIRSNRNRVIGTMAEWAVCRIPASEFEELDMDHKVYERKGVSRKATVTVPNCQYHRKEQDPRVPTECDGATSRPNRHPA